jgi:hypothetical protein
VDAGARAKCATRAIADRRAQTSRSNNSGMIMANDNWNGSSDNWNNPADWSGGLPAAYDTAVATGGVVSVTDSESVGGVNFSGGAELLINGGYLDVGAGTLGANVNSFILGPAGAVLTGSFSVLEVGSYVTGTASGTVYIEGTDSQFFWEPQLSSDPSPATGVDASNLVVEFNDGGNGGNFMLGAAFNGTVAGFQSGDSINWTDQDLKANGTFTSSIGNNSVTLTDSDGHSITVNFAGAPNQYNSSNIFVSSSGFITTSITCFVTGTRIRTENGDVAVEDLSVGDIAVTRDGRRKAIRWIGHRNVRCDRHPRPQAAWPVRVQAGAFGEGLPYADLWLSPGHALCLDNCLVPARALVDGRRVVSVEQDSVVYWHIELDGHDVLLANGMPAESYLDTGNRSFFEDGPARQLHFDEGPARGHDGSGFCLPLVESGPRLSAIRARWLGEPVRQSAATAVRLVADETEVAPFFVSPTELRFLAPAGATEVRLRSASFLAGGGDARRLGVVVGSLAVSDGSGWRNVDLDDPGLFAGFHEIERNAQSSWRWTDGEAHISPQLWADFEGGALIRVTGVFEHARAAESVEPDERAVA